MLECLGFPWFPHKPHRDHIIDFWRFPSILKPSAVDDSSHVKTKSCGTKGFEDSGHLFVSNNSMSCYLWDIAGVWREYVSTCTGTLTITATCLGCPYTLLFEKLWKCWRSLVPEEPCHVLIASKLLRWLCGSGTSAGHVTFSCSFREVSNLKSHNSRACVLRCFKWPKRSPRARRFPGGGAKGRAAAAVGGFGAEVGQGTSTAPRRGAFFCRGWNKGMLHDFVW